MKRTKKQTEAKKLDPREFDLEKASGGYGYGGWGSYGGGYSGGWGGYSGGYGGYSSSGFSAEGPVLAAMHCGTSTSSMLNMEFFVAIADDSWADAQAGSSLTLSAPRGAVTFEPIDTALCRLAITPLANLRSYQARDLIASLDQLGHLVAARDRAGAALAAAIHAAVPGTADKRARRRLIRAKRQVLAGTPNDLTPQEAAPFAALQADFTAHANAVEMVRAQHPALYDEAMAASSRALTTEVDDPWFRRALLDASPSVFSGLHYLDADKRTKARRNAEHSVAAYVARGATRATPVSTFSGVARAQLMPDQREPVTTAGALELRTLVRLNKRLRPVLLRHLYGSPGFLDTLTITRNPLVAVAGPVLLAPSPSLRGAYNRCPRTPLLGHLFAALAEGDGGVPDAEVLRGVLRSVRPNDDAEAGVRQLLATGALRADHAAFVEGPEWVEPLRALLETLPADPIIDAGINALNLSTQAIRTYASATADEREAVLGDLRAAWTPVTGGNALPTRFLYEDAAVAARVDLSARVYAPAIASMSAWIEATAALSWSRVEVAAMEHFFRAFYGGTQPQPLLQFYRDYFVRFLHGDLRSTMERSGFSLAAAPRATETRALRARLDSCVRARVTQANGAEEVHLSPDDLAFLPRVCGSASQSYSVYMFPLRSGRIVVPGGNYHPGFGKFFSRFLPLLGPEVTERLRATNDAFGDGIAELQGDDDENCNLHPRLLKETLEPDALWVQPSRGGDLCLTRGRGGPPLRPVDVGFLDARQRSVLHKLLMCFGQPPTFALSLPWPDADDDEVSTRPRIVFDRHLVIGRRAWRARTSTLPDPARHRDAAFFERLWRWRGANGLPAAGFVRAQFAADFERRGPTMPDPRRRSSLGRLGSFRYLDFASPLSVAAFARDLRALAAADEDTFVVVEELLPDVDDAPRFEGQPHAAEFVVQLQGRA